MTTGITSTKSIAVEVEPCCTRQGPHVHYVPRKPPVNAAGDVDVFDASNQPTMDVYDGSMSAGVEHDATEHEEIVEEEEVITETQEIEEDE